MNALVPHASSSLSYGEMERLAASIAKSGLFGIKTPDQAVALMMIAQAEGQHPALAARDYDVIQGRPAKKAEAMLRDFLQAGGKVEWHTLSDEMADATFIHPQGGSARINWDMARANKAGLTGKDNYKKFPRQMLRSRTVSEGVRTVWPLATSGMHVPEELRDIQASEPFTGETIDAEPPQRAATASDARSAINAAVPLRAAAAATPRAPSVAARPERTDEQWRVWLEKMRAAVAVLRSRDEVVEVANRSTVGDALATGPAFVQREISAILAENYARFGDEAEADDFPGDLPDVEITGADKVLAG